jgi:flagellar protein FliO/FliZ
MYKSILGTGLPFIFVVTFVAVLALVSVIARAVRRYATLQTERSNVWHPRQPRLSVIEHARIDMKHCLVLVRRDEVEHLLMIGDKSDIVVDANIVRATHKLSTVRLSTMEMLEKISQTESDGDNWPLRPTASPERVSSDPVWLGARMGQTGEQACSGRALFIASNSQAGIEASGGNAAVLVNNTLLDSNTLGALSAVSSGRILTYQNNTVIGSPGSGFTGTAAQQ